MEVSRVVRSPKGGSGKAGWQAASRAPSLPTAPPPTPRACIASCAESARQWPPTLPGSWVPTSPLPPSRHPSNWGAVPKGGGLAHHFAQASPLNSPERGPPRAEEKPPAPGGREAAGPHSRAPCPPQARLRAQPGGAAPSAQSPRPSGCRQKEEPQDPSLLRLCPPPLPPKEAAASADRDTLAAINFYLVKAQSVPVVSIDSVSGKQITGLRVGAWVGVRGLRGRGHPPHLLPLPWKLWSPIGQNTWGGLGLN